MAGCSVAPSTPLSAVEWPTAARFSAQPEPAAAEPMNFGWRQYFADPVLQRLLEQALVGNRDLRVAQLGIAQAAAQLGLREAERMPAVGVGVAGSSAQQPNGSQLRIVNSGAQFSAWELDFFGRLANLSDAARAQLLASQEASRAARLALVAAVASAWLNLIADEELLALTEQTLATREESLRLTRLRFDNGAASELDFRQAQSLAEGAKVVRAQQQRQRALNRNALALLLGAPGAELPDFSARRLGDVKLSELPAGLPSRVLAARPDIRQAEQTLLAANANIEAARAAFFPRVTLTGAFGSVSRDLSGLFAGGSWGFTVAPALLQPIFDGGRNRSLLESARVARELALTQYERAIQTGFREIADALASRGTLLEQLSAQAAVAEAERVRLDLAQLRYQNGIASYLDLLDAQRSLFTANQAVIQTRLQLLQNQVLLFRSLGGGDLS
jgi:NodT family efflux transporter outer membrane factor (OMF) lipoprotein